MQRGEVRLIDIEPARGSEANKRRPGIIVSNDRANATADRLRRGIVTRSTRDQQHRPRLPNSGPLRGLERIKPGQWGAVRVVENTTTKQVEREAVTVAVEAT